MTRISISNEMAAKYPEFADRVGEAIQHSEYQRVLSDAKYAEKVANKNSKVAANTGDVTVKLSPSKKVAKAKAPKKIKVKKSS